MIKWSLTDLQKGNDECIDGAQQHTYKLWIFGGFAYMI